MTWFKLAIATFILGVFVFHVLPQIPAGCVRIEARTHEARGEK